jgi:hypothetical protein
MAESKPYKVEVIADDSGKWCGNGLSFATEAEAETYAEDLMRRWMLVEDWRVVKAPPETVKDETVDAALAA